MYVDHLLKKRIIAYQKEVLRRKKKFVACFDGGYSHRRNASECIVEIIHPEDKKIFAYCITAKANGHRKDAYYKDSSKSLEIIALRKLLDDWGTKNIFSGYCHDLDSAARVTIEKAGIKLIEYFDHNHSRNHFDTLLNSVDRKYKGALNGIKSKLKRHYQACLGLKDLESMKNKWTECTKHFLGIESKWKNKTNEESIKALRELVIDTSHVFDHILVGIRTQLNECFHSMKCRFVDKRLAFSVSWHTRVQLAILEFNWPGEWQLELARMLNIKFPKEHIKRIMNMLRKRKVKRMKRRESRYIQFEKERRYKRRLERLCKDMKDDSYIYHDDIARKKEKESIDLYNRIEMTSKYLPYTDPKKPLPPNYVLTSGQTTHLVSKKARNCYNIFSIPIERLKPEPNPLPDKSEIPKGDYSSSSCSDIEYIPTYPTNEEEDFLEYIRTAVNDKQDIWRNEEEEEEEDEESEEELMLYESEDDYEYKTKFQVEEEVDNKNKEQFIILSGSNCEYLNKSTRNKN